MAGVFCFVFFDFCASGFSGLVFGGTWESMKMIRIESFRLVCE